MFSTDCKKGITAKKELAAPVEILPDWSKLEALANQVIEKPNEDKPLAMLKADPELVKPNVEIKKDIDTPQKLQVSTEFLANMDYWTCYQKNIGGMHLFQRPAPRTGFYRLDKKDGYQNVLFKRDSQFEKNMIEVFAAIFMKELMDTLYQRGDLVATAGFAHPPAEDSDRIPYIYSVLFDDCNVLYQDAVAALHTKDNLSFLNKNIDKLNGYQTIVPGKPWLPTPCETLWLQETNRYQHYFQLVGLSLYVGDPDIHSGNFCSVPNGNSDFEEIELPVQSVGNKKFKIFQDVSAARFDFGGVRKLTNHVYLKPVQGLLHYNLGGAGFHFATFARAVRKNYKIYNTLADIALLPDSVLESSINTAMKSFRAYCTPSQIIKFYASQNISIEIDQNDGVDELLTKGKKSILDLYVRRRMSLQYQVLQFLTSIDSLERRKYLAEHQPSLKLIDLDGVNIAETSDIAIETAIQKKIIFLTELANSGFEVSTYSSM